MKGLLASEQWLAEYKARTHRHRLQIAGETSPAVDEANRAKVEAAAALPSPYERDIQSAILQLLEIHPRVSWAARMNSVNVKSVMKNPSAPRRAADSSMKYGRSAAL